MEQAVRDEFEANAKVRWSTDYDDFGDGLFSIQADGRYEYEHIQWDWETWQASRAALRVEDEIDRLKAENEELRGALQAVVDDPAWRSNDNTLWPKIIKALGKGATQ
ncbi:TPA: hypothetical protein N2B33_005740 [Pseudomonas aeruginosa]|nr:hypothetical protein [Pseudomonas aeruginosa]